MTGVARDLTVGDLRLALAGIPDELPIRVLAALEPGGDVTIQTPYEAEVVLDADCGCRGAGPGWPPPRPLWFELTCDFPRVTCD